MFCHRDYHLRWAGAADALLLAWHLEVCPACLGSALGSFPAAFLSGTLSVERKHQKAQLLMRPRFTHRLMFSDFEHHDSHLALPLSLLLTEM